VELTEIAVRLAVAVLVGGILGINRELHHKSAGLRTHALVSLGSALAVVTILSMVNPDANAVSRVIQGLVTGVGFIGAGVILHHEGDHRVIGLSTAATVWVAAALGIACGSGHWATAVVALVLALGVLVFGGPIERACDRTFGRTTRSDDDGGR
jgi:putative Mg2+ transporter-C (MgtC) family protein